jgi:hypothetical protein
VVGILVFARFDTRIEQRVGMYRERSVTISARFIPDEGLLREATEVYLPRTKSFPKAICGGRLGLTDD